MTASLPALAFDLDRLARVGDRFVLLPDVPDDGRHWQPVVALLTDPAVLDAAIDRVARRLGTGDRPLAASVLFQGWAGRLTSIHAGSITLGTPIPDLAAPRLHFHQPATGPVDLALTTATPLDPATAWRRITDDHLGPLIDALRTRVRLASRQLWGNAASAFAGSLATLARTGHADLRHLIRRPWAAPPPLDRLGRWVETAEGLRFARTTCCGLERLPDRDRCNDCSLRWPTTSLPPPGPQGRSSPEPAVSPGRRRGW